MAPQPRGANPSRIFTLQSLRRPHRPSCLEALPAKHRSSLRRPERHCGFLPTLRASCLRFRTHRRVSTAASALGPLRLTTLASLRFVFESLVGEKHLFAGCKHKFGAAIRALQYPIVEFHEPLPLNPYRAGEGVYRALWALKNSGTCSSGLPGMDPWGLRAQLDNSYPTSPPDRGLIPEVRRRAASRADLILLATLLLAQSLPRKRFFGPAFLSGLHVEAVLLDFLDDVFLLHFALKTAQCILKRFTLLNDDFGHVYFTPIQALIGFLQCSNFTWALPLKDYRMRTLPSCSQFHPAKSSFLSAKSV